MRPLLAIALSLIPSLLSAAGGTLKLEAIAQSYEATSRVAYPAELAEDIELAENVWRQRVSVAPDDAKAWTSLGFVLLEQEKAEAAVDAFSTVISLEPSTAAQMGLGLASKAQGDITKARAAFQAVIATNEWAPFGYLQMGYLLKEQRELAEATDYFEKAARVAPIGRLGAMSYWEVGQTLLAQGETEKALQAYQRAVGLETEETELWRSLATALQLQGRTLELEKALGELGRVETENEQLPSQRSINPLAEEFSTWRYQERVQTARDFLERYPNNVTEHIELGRALRKIGQFETAAETFRQAIALSPNNASAHYYLSEVLQDLERTEEAEAAYTEASTLSPSITTLARRELYSLQSPQGGLHIPLLVGDIPRTPLPNTLSQFPGVTLIQPPVPPAVPTIRTVPVLPGAPSPSADRPGRPPLPNVILEPGRDRLEMKLLTDPDSADLYDNLGHLLYKQENFTDAIAAFEKVAQLDPRLAFLAFNNIGVIRHEQGQLEAAEAAFAKAIDMEVGVACGPKIRNQGRVSSEDRVQYP